MYLVLEACLLAFGLASVICSRWIHKSLDRAIILKRAIIYTTATQLTICIPVIYNSPKLITVVVCIFLQICTSYFAVVFGIELGAPWIILYTSGTLEKKGLRVKAILQRRCFVLVSTDSNAILSVIQQSWRKPIAIFTVDTTDTIELAGVKTYKLIASSTSDELLTAILKHLGR